MKVSPTHHVTRRGVLKRNPEIIRTEVVITDFHEINPGVPEGKAIQVSVNGNNWYVPLQGKSYKKAMQDQARRAAASNKYFANESQRVSAMELRAVASQLEDSQ